MQIGWCHRLYGVCGHRRVGDNESGKYARELFDGLKLVTTKFSKQPSRCRIGEGVGKGLGSNSSCISGRISWHKIGSRNIFPLRDAFFSSGRDVHSVASVVLDSAANVPAVNAMGCPCATIGRVFVDEDFGARWCQRGLIKTEISIELSFCQKAWINARRTEEFQGQCGLVQQPVPNMKWELGVTAPENGNQVVFVGLDCPFLCIGAVEVGWDQLKMDAVFIHKLLLADRIFVVEHLKLGSET